MILSADVEGDGAIGSWSGYRNLKKRKKEMTCKEGSIESLEPTIATSGDGTSDHGNTRGAHDPYSRRRTSDLLRRCGSSGCHKAATIDGRAGPSPERYRRGRMELCEARAVARLLPQADVAHQPLEPVVLTPLPLYLGGRAPAPILRRPVVSRGRSVEGKCGKQTVVSMARGSWLRDRGPISRASRGLIASRPHERLGQGSPHPWVTKRAFGSRSLERHNPAHAPTPPGGPPTQPPRAVPVSPTDKSACQPGNLLRDQDPQRAAAEVLPPEALYPDARLRAGPRIPRGEGLFHLVPRAAPAPATLSPYSSVKTAPSEGEAVCASERVS